MDQVTCRKCHYLVSKEWYFCPNCGKKLRRPPLSVSVLTQVNLYLICILFPPFGIIPGFRYLFQSRMKAAIIGFVCIGLTIVTTGVLLLSAQKAFMTLQERLDSQMEYYNELGL